MPLPAWRAALFASLVDDPAGDVSEDLATVQRAHLFQLLEEILPLDAAKKPSLFRSVRELLQSLPGETPTVMDPFCGGGSTLLEAQRLGLRTIGSDLNPIPILITTVLTRYPSLFSDVSPVNPQSRLQQSLAASGGKPLVEDVRYYAGVIGRRAQTELQPFYPELERHSPGGGRQTATVMSWIWSRTVTCPEPSLWTGNPTSFLIRTHAF